MLAARLSEDPSPPRAAARGRPGRSRRTASAVVRRGGARSRAGSGRACGRRSPTGSSRSRTCAVAASAGRRRSTRWSRCRGEPDDYDEWERDFGCDGWGWEAVRAVVRAHRARPDRRRADGVGRGQHCVRRRPFPMPPAGVELTRDARGSAGLGRRRLPRRRPGERPNLTIRGEALVDRVLARRTVALAACGSPTATEIEAGLVIVSAGAIHSPAILLRSGIDTSRRSATTSTTIRRSRSPCDRSRPPTPTALAITTVGGVLVDRDGSSRPPAAADGVRRSDATRTTGCCSSAVMRVHSRGTAAPRGQRPDGRIPSSSSAMLSDERDWVALSAAIDEAERVLAHPAMACRRHPVDYDRSPRRRGRSARPLLPRRGHVRDGDGRRPARAGSSATRV